MILSSILVGTILIACGFLVKENPNLIAGYNTLSDEKKEKIDIINLSIMMKKGFIIIGLIIIILGFILSILGTKESYGILITSSIVIVGIIVMIIRARKFECKY